MNAPAFAGRAAALLVAALLGACASTGDLVPRGSPNDPAALAAALSLSGAPRANAWPEEDWWKRFGDPQLDALIAEALENSPTLALARARIDRALAVARAAGADLAPQVAAGADVNRQRFSSNGIFPPPIAGAWFTQYQLTANLGYELDLWGKNRAALQAALGEARAAEIDGYAARLALATAVAQAYVELARAYDQLDIAQRTLAQREAILDLTRQRLAAGLDSQIELKQVEGSIPAARESVASIEEEIALQRNQIAALLGKGPDRGLSIERPRLSAFRLGMPSVLPADLLGRRPDVVASRERVEAARHGIEAARAQFYPNVNLMALIGVQSVTFGKLLASGSDIPSLGGALRLPVFDGGRLRANLAERDAAYDIAVAQYNQTLAEALRDVVDQLTSLSSVAVRRKQAEQSLAAAEQAHRLAIARYSAGLGSYLQVLATETQVLEEQRIRADLRARELALTIALARALGGGFEDRSASAAPLENLR